MQQANSSKRILYIQYTNPAGYPPLEHSSRILANNGWQVLFLGTGAQGANSLQFPSHPQVCVRQMAFQPAGWRQKLHYMQYCVWVLYWTLRFRPQWIYASDPLSCPAALLLNWLLSVPVLYHEHDSPSEVNSTHRFQRLVLWSRRKLAQRVTACVLPSIERVDHFISQTGSQPEHMLCVWNCPSVEEIGEPRVAQNNGGLKLLFHGSIVPERLPETIVDALALLPTVTLTIVGYETVGSKGYLRYLESRAIKLGVERQLEIVGAVPTRQDLFAYCRDADVGLAFMPKDSMDINVQTMFSGPSNKVFDYLASGLALLISDRPQWREMYVDQGYGLSCDASDPSSITAALRWYLEHPAEMLVMGEYGRQRILNEWNYEHLFELVLAALDRKDSLAKNIPRPTC